MIEYMNMYNTLLYDLQEKHKDKNRLLLTEKLFFPLVLTVFAGRSVGLTSISTDNT